MPRANNAELYFNDILEDIRNGSSLRKACRDRGMSRNTFTDYITTDESLESQYAMAVEERGDACLDEINDVAVKLKDNLIEPAAARVLIDTEKWKAAKFYPKMYGDKQTVVHAGGVTVMPTILKDGKEFNVKVGDDVPSTEDN